MTAIQPAPVVHVSEVFGPTVQGEGPYAGRACTFVRLGGCNLSCGPCDTPYTWDGRRYDLRHEITATPVGEVVEQVAARAPLRCPQLVVVSGGEPLIHQHKPGLRHLVDQLTNLGYEIHFETNGTLPPATWMVANDAVQWVVSPKLVGPLATDPEHRRLVPEALAWWAVAARGSRVHFKIVVGQVGDLQQVLEFTHRYRIPRHRVYVMPAGDRADQVLAGARAIAEAAAREGFGVSLRAHLLLWPDESRGR